MGFYTGILIKSSPPKGGVHKLMILLKDLPKEFLRKFFGEEMDSSQSGSSHRWGAAKKGSINDIRGPKRYNETAFQRFESETL